MHPHHLRLNLLVLASLSWFAVATVAAALVPVKLSCEERANPLGIDEAQPRLTWRVESSERGQQQTAYQILVADSEDLLSQDQGDYWDSGQVASDQTIQVAYQGKPLTSRRRCYWKVRVWDEAGKASAWSQPALWTMGLLQPADWSANWITASKWFMPPDLRPRGLVVSSGGWADVDLGEPYPIDAIKLYFSDTNTAPKRFQILGADDLQFSHPQVLVDQSAADDQPLSPGPQVFAVKGAKAVGFVKSGLAQSIYAELKAFRINRPVTAGGSNSQKISAPPTPPPSPDPAA